MRGSGPIASISSSLIPEVMKRANAPSPSGTPSAAYSRRQLARGVDEPLEHRLDLALGGDRQHDVAHRAQGRALLVHLALEDRGGALYHVGPMRMRSDRHRSWWYPPT